MADTLINGDILALGEDDLGLDDVSFYIFDGIQDAGVDGQQQPSLTAADLRMPSDQPFFFDEEGEDLFMSIQQANNSDDVSPNETQDSNDNLIGGSAPGGPSVTPPSTAPGSPTSMDKAPHTKQRARRKSTLVEEPRKDMNTVNHKVGKEATPAQAAGNTSKEVDNHSADSTSKSSEKLNTTKPSSKRCYKKRRTEGLEGFLAAGPTIDEAIASGLIPPLPEGDTKEIRKQRRLIRNRVSAQLHRERKKLYVENLENRVREQADTIDELEAQIESLKAQLAKATSTCASGAQIDGMSGSTNGTLSNPTSSCERPSKRPKSVRLMGREKPSHSTRPGSGSASPTNASTDVDSDRASSDSSVSDGESNDANKHCAANMKRTSKGFKRPAPLDTKPSSFSTDMMNGPLIPTPTDAFFNMGDSIKAEADATQASRNPRKRAFFMMGMFLFTALFGGSILNLSRQDIGSGRAFMPASLSSPFSSSKESNTDARSIVTQHHFDRRRRHLMSVDDDSLENAIAPDIVSAPPLENVKENSLEVKSPVDSSSTALWNDLVDMPVNRTEKCLAANLLSSVSSAVNASRALAKGKLFPAPNRGTSAGKKLRGVENAVVPYENMARMMQVSNLNGGASRALTSVMTLHQHMQAAMAGPTDNASTILCPKPYGILGANTSHAIDDNLVLLLPSSSVAQFLKTMDANEEAVDNSNDGEKSSSSSKKYEWDGTWVEVDATITGIRHIPTFGGELSGHTNGAILL